MELFENVLSMNNMNENNEKMKEEFKGGIENLLEKKGKGKKNKEKDENIPKIPSNPYILFSVDKRSFLKQKYPGMRPNDITVKLGELWQSLDENEKKHYVDGWERDKERYQNEKIKYKELYGDKKSTKVKNKKSPTAFKRFWNEKKDEVKEKNSELKYQELYRLMGKMWREMSDEEKGMYKKVKEVKDEDVKE